MLPEPNVVPVLAPGDPLTTVTTGVPGEGSTLLAVVPPWFCTVMVAVNACPRDSVAGDVTNDVTTRFGGSCTFTRLLFVEGVATAAPELMSVPFASVEKRKVPAAVPVSV